MEMEPAEVPKRVISAGSPPKAAALSATHWKAVTWSSRPMLPGTCSVSRSRKPKMPRRYCTVTTTTSPAAASIRPSYSSMPVEPMVKRPPLSQRRPDVQVETGLGDVLIENVHRKEPLRVLRLDARGRQATGVPRLRLPALHRDGGPEAERPHGRLPVGDGEEGGHLLVAGHLLDEAAQAAAARRHGNRPQHLRRHLLGAQAIVRAQLLPRGGGGGGGGGGGRGGGGTEEEEEEEVEVVAVMLANHCCSWPPTLDCVSRKYSRTAEMMADQRRACRRMRRSGRSRI
ncbi:hypothetical protein TYRP_016296 [Tyrophagus putrescentiae]|nr:hypothetical protein TYRP_016296 [Tyrophagus putrescentiae]